MTDQVSQKDALVAGLLEASREAGIDAREVACLERLSGGANKEMWAFDLVVDGGEALPLVLRRQPSEARFASQGLDQVRTEAKIITIAEGAGVPVPKIQFELPDGSVAGDGYVMERLEGETLGSRILKLPQLANARAQMAMHCGEILGRLHSAQGAQSLGLETRDTKAALEALEERHLANRQNRPVFEFAFAWLKDNLPEASKMVLLHGDFRNGNLMVGPEGIRAVLDWELCHFGPSAYDLAWLCIPSWRFQRPDLPVGGFGSFDQLMEGYAVGGGTSIRLEELRAWMVFQTLNWGVMCAGAAVAFGNGHRSVEGAVIARRASETEFDLMRMLAPENSAWSEFHHAR